MTIFRTDTQDKHRRRIPLLLVAVASLALAFISLHAAAEPSAAYGHAAVTFRGKVTVDGSPAPAGTGIVVRNSSGAVIGGGLTGANALPADSYAFIVPESRAPFENSIVTVTAVDFAEVESVDVRYVYFGASVTADIATFTEPRPDPPEPVEGQALIPIPQFVNISPSSTALDGDGSNVRVIGGTIRIGGIGEIVGVPVVLAGKALESLDDPVTGITIRRVDGQMVIRIPFRDENGDDTIRVLVDTPSLSGTGFVATGQVSGLRIDAPTRSRDFSEFDPRVGLGSVKVLGDITSFPGDSLLEMNLVPIPPDTERLKEALAERDEEPVDIAFAVEFVKTRLDPALGTITLRLSVGKQWFDAQEVGSVIVVRLADDGSAQFFPFVPIDPDANPIRFNLDSPEGLSAFVITAVREAEEPTPTPEPTATATPTPPPTPTPTPTSTPTAPPTATATSAPTPTTTATAPTSQPTPTPVPPTATPVSTATPVPTPQVTATAAADAATPVPQPTATPAPDGGSCNAPVDGRVSAGHLAMLLSPLVLFAFRKRRSG